jgi:5-methylcytosine-specific restriction endonuclease McrA
MKNDKLNIVDQTQIKNCESNTDLSRELNFEVRTLTKKQIREEVYNKYKGHCAYCGREIEYKKMQVDHIFPKSKQHWCGHENMQKLNPNIIIPTKVDEIINYNPSCRRCNYHKNNLTIEEFRHMISNKLKVLNTDWHYIIAKDFGQIVESAMPVVFYFEKVSTE